MRTTSRTILCLLLATCLASVAQAQTTNLYSGTINGQSGIGISVPIAGIHTEPGGTAQPTNLRGVGIPGPTAGAPGLADLTAGGGFTLPAGDFFIATSFTNPSPTTPTFTYSHTTATVSNGAGNFAPGFFTAAFGTSNTVTVTGTGPNGPAGKAVFKPGTAGFGGTMRLMGIFRNKFNVVTTNLAVSLFDIPFNPTIVGASNPAGAPPPKSTWNTGAYAYNTGLMSGYTFPANLSGWPWITGKITFTDTAPALVSVLTETGMDNRVLTTPTAGVVAGAGSIKMVTGYMLHIAFVDDNVGEWEMNVEFLPEPSRAMLAGAGVLFLGALVQLRRRRG